MFKSYKDVLVSNNVEFTTDTRKRLTAPSLPNLHPDADAFHLFIECQFFRDTRLTVINMLNEIGFTCETFNWIFGFMSTDEITDVANLILSSFRWIVWKKNCDVKNKNKGWELCTMIQFLNYLYNHLSVLLKSKKMRLKESVLKKCEHIRMMCENSLPFKC